MRQSFTPKHIIHFGVGVSYTCTRGAPFFHCFLLRSLEVSLTTQLELLLRDYLNLTLQKIFISIFRSAGFHNPSCEKAMKKARNVSFISLYTYNTFALVSCEIPSGVSLCFFPAIIMLLFYYQASIPALVYWAMINIHINCD